MANRSRDWYNQANHDLNKARLDLQNGFFEWACFTAHQAAEKAIKAVYLANQGDARGHGIRDLIFRLGKGAGETLLHQATILDKFYIPTRYPDGLPEGTLHDAYSKIEAESAITAAEKIIEWCQSYLPFH